MMTSHDMLTRKMLHAPHPSGLVFSGPVNSRVGMMTGYFIYIASNYAFFTANYFYDNFITSLKVVFYIMILLLLILEVEYSRALLLLGLVKNVKTHL